MAGDTYYVSADGSDERDGKAPDRAWRTLQKAGARVYRSGDRLLLRGGDSFAGSLKLQKRPGPRPHAPIAGRYRQRGGVLLRSRPQRLAQASSRGALGLKANFSL